jgi:hypothetical protein
VTYQKTADDGADVTWTVGSLHICSVRLYTVKGGVASPPDLQSGSIHLNFEVRNTISFIEIRAEK